MSLVISMNAVAAVAFDLGGMLGYNLVNLATTPEVCYRYLYLFIAEYGQFFVEASNSDFQPFVLSVPQDLMKLLLYNA